VEGEQTSARFLRRSSLACFFSVPRRLEMGVISTVLGFFGFGIGLTLGLLIGYYMFIYFQPTDVKVHTICSLPPFLPSPVFFFSRL
jgi:hypothetical protein